MTSLEQLTGLATVPTGIYVDGRWTDAENGARLDIDDPATGEVLCEVADASPADAMSALAAADEAREGWAATPPRVRGELLRSAFELITERSEPLARLMTLEMGKPVAESLAEVTYAADFMRWFSEEAVRLDGRWASSPNGDARTMVSLRPVGPSILITPWNFPLAMGTRKVGPAIAAGCTMVVKPARQTPLSMLAFAGILDEVGVPAGVVNVVVSSRSGDVIEPLLADPRSRKLSFTGSTPVGQRLVQQASGQLLRMSMELGGNAPFIVLDDADLDAALDGAMIAKMRNGGEACTAANRFLVHESLYDEFAERLAGRMGALRVGPGIEDGSQVGPLIDAPAVQSMVEFVDQARRGGATVLCGGEPIDREGFFFAPTVLADVPPESVDTEIFGPIAPVSRVSSDDEAIALANATEYGLVAYLYTADLKRAIRFSERLEVGMVGVNRGLVSNAGAPFGGVKSSGFGREGGAEGIHEYLETQYLSIDL